MTIFCNDLQNVASIKAVLWLSIKNSLSPPCSSFPESLECFDLQLLFRSFWLSELLPVLEEHVILELPWQ